MQFLSDLWLPILVGGLGMWVMSILVWTALPNHKTEFAKITNEDAVMAALRAGGVTPGLYIMPHMGPDGKGMGTPEGRAKMMQGPIAHLRVAPSGVPAMGPMIAQSFLSSLLVSVFTGYVAFHTLPAGTEYLPVFRIVGTVVFMTYSIGSVPESIWFARPWKSFGLQCIDAALYAGVAAGIFGWLWR